MADQIFLVAPDNADATAFAPRLKAMLAAIPVAVLLLPHGERADPDYVALVKSIAPLAQAKGVAVLLDNRPDLVKPLGADGVHITGGIKTVREAIATLKPDHIVGTGDIGSLHEAMLRGELDIDYLFFGDREQSDAEMADWWAETFEVPSVYLAAGIEDPALATIGTEFIAFDGAVWDAPESLARLTGASS